MDAPCEHFEGLVAVEPVGAECGQCIEMGDRWVHLRGCLTCGLVGCCDASKNRHARQHWQETGHPIIRSMEPGEQWKYCFEDGAVAR